MPLWVPCAPKPKISLPSNAHSPVLAAPDAGTLRSMAGTFLDLLPADILAWVQALAVGATGAPVVVRLATKPWATAT
jgi:hypothetical protein